MSDKDQEREDWPRPDRDLDEDTKRHDLGDQGRPGGGREENTLPDRDGPPRK